MFSLFFLCYVKLSKVWLKLQAPQAQSLASSTSRTQRQPLSLRHMPFELRRMPQMVPLVYLYFIFFVFKKIIVMLTKAASLICFISWLNIGLPTENHTQIVKKKVEMAYLKMKLNAESLVLLFSSPNRISKIEFTISISSWMMRMELCLK